MVNFVGTEISGMAEFRKRNCSIVVFGNDSQIKAGDSKTN